jgi:hypothetical protein
MKLKWLIHLGLFVALAALLASGLGKKPQQAFQTFPNQSIDVGAAALSTAKRHCENWALAAGLETMLRKQGVALDQSFWIMRINLGELCVDTLPSIESVARVVNNEFVLDDGRHVQLAVRYSPGPPTNVDGVIAGLQQQQVAVLLFHGHPFYLTGATYDLQIGRDGLRRYIIKELRLANTFMGEPGLTFQRYREDNSEIEGILTVSVAVK